MLSKAFYHPGKWALERCCCAALSRSSRIRDFHMIWVRLALHSSSVVSPFRLSILFHYYTRAGDNYTIAALSTAAKFPSS